MPRDQALVKAGSTRLRPIVMTTLAMIFGMLPLAFAIGAGAEMRAPMARAVIGGLITSTLLTLVVVPVVYTYLDGLRPETVRALAPVPPSPQGGDGRRRPRRSRPDRGLRGYSTFGAGPITSSTVRVRTGPRPRPASDALDLRPVAHDDEGRARRVDRRDGRRTEGGDVHRQGLRDEGLEEPVGKVEHHLVDHPGRHLGGRLEVARVAEGRVAARALHLLGRRRRPDPAELLEDLA